MQVKHPMGKNTTRQDKKKFKLKKHLEYLYKTKVYFSQVLSEFLCKMVLPLLLPRRYCKQNIICKFERRRDKPV